MVSTFWVNFVALEDVNQESKFKTHDEKSCKGLNFCGIILELTFLCTSFVLLIILFLTVMFLISRYGVVKTPGDMEMRPLESDDEDDEDVTMFNRKN